MPESICGRGIPEGTISEDLGGHPPDSHPIQSTIIWMSSHPSVYYCYFVSYKCFSGILQVWGVALLCPEQCIQCSCTLVGGLCDFLAFMSHHGPIGRLMADDDADGRWDTPDGVPTRTDC